MPSFGAGWPESFKTDIPNFSVKTIKKHFYSSEFLILFLGFKGKPSEEKSPEFSEFGTLVLWSTPPTTTTISTISWSWLPQSKSRFKVHSKCKHFVMWWHVRICWLCWYELYYSYWPVPTPCDGQAWKWACRLPGARCFLAGLADIQDGKLEKLTSSQSIKHSS